MIRHPTEPTLPAWLEQAWLTRYLDRGLTDAECEWFETYLIQCPHLIEALERDNALRDALHAQGQVEPGHTVATAGNPAAEQPPLVTHASPVETPSTSPDNPAPSISQPDASTPVHRTPSRRRWQPFATAASLAVAAVLGAAVASFDVINPPAASTTAPVSPRRLVFDTLRGVTSASIPPMSGKAAAPMLVEIAIPPQAQAVAAYFDDGFTLALEVSTEGFVSFLIPERLLLNHSRIRLNYLLNGKSNTKTINLIVQ